MADHGHQPVLARETIELLSPQPGEIAVDCTLGRGGHAALLAKAIGPAGHLIGFDLDPENVSHVARRIEALGVPFTGYHESFIRAPRRLADLGLQAGVVLADLGFSSRQMDDPARGLSFRADGPLDMRFDPTAPTTAADLLALRDEAELADIIARYGEEPLARKIARNLVRAREIKPIETTAELARLVVESYGARARSSRMHPATRTFMALRIAVNGELDALDGLLEAVARGAEATGGGGWMTAGARIAVISFHSLEDRRVKRVFADLARRGAATRLTGKPITADPQEVRANVRARSAKLRAVRIDGSVQHDSPEEEAEPPPAPRHGR
jgi:16S rRNA (cytosine1402-N4)-methyltransferase